MAATEQCAIRAALARADGTAQAWNEVYQHPERVPQSELQRRFTLLQQLERRALASGAVHWGCQPECGLPRSKLNQYIQTVGLDVDIGVGSLILILNAMPGVVTLSSCSSVHENAHEEEALVAFTCSSSTAAKIEKCVGMEHFREVRTDKVRLKGRPVSSFQSYIVHSAAVGPDGEPDAQARWQQLMRMAEQLFSLASEASDEAEAPKEEEVKPEPECQKKRKRKRSRPTEVEALTLLLGGGKVSRGPKKPKLHTTFSPLCQPEDLARVREEVVAGLRGLHAIEAEDVCAMAHPIDLKSEAMQSMPHLSKLLASLRGQAIREHISACMGCGPLSAADEDSFLLVAVPPTGFWLPRGAVPRRGAGSAVAFSLFLTEDWWREEDGGCLQIYSPDAVKPAVAVVPCFNSLLVYDASATIACTRVVTDQAPQLSIHGIFYREESAAPVASAASESDPGGPKVPGATVSPTDMNVSFAAADKEDLRKWVNLKQLSAKRIATTRKRFTKKSHILLRNFLQPEVATSLSELLSSKESKDGCEAGWELMGPARCRSYLSFRGENNNSVCAAGKALHKVAVNVSSPAFLRYVTALTGVKADPSAVIPQGEVRRFRPGLDYIRRGSAVTPQLDIILCVSSKTGAKAADAYVEAVADWDENLMAGNSLPPPLMRFRPVPNSLRIVLRDTKTAHFLEMPTPSDEEHQPRSRWDVALSLVMEPMSDSEEEGEEEEAEPQSETDV